MAFTTEFNGTNAAVTGRFSAILKSVTTRIANYRVYRKTMNELSALSSRELDDLGLNRSMIKSIALEAAYGL